MQGLCSSARSHCDRYFRTSFYSRPSTVGRAQRYKLRFRPAMSVRFRENARVPRVSTCGAKRTPLPHVRFWAEATLRRWSLSRVIDRGRCLHPPPNGLGESLG